VRPGGDPDAFLLFGQADKDHLGIVFSERNQVNQPRLWKGREQFDTVLTAVRRK